MPVSAIILAGGASRRMGTDKALLRITPHSVTLIEHVVSVAATLADDLIVVTEEGSRLPPMPVRVVGDAIPHGGPLAGMVAGFAMARHETVLVLACDLPFLSIPLLHYMVSLLPAWDAVVPVLPSDANPLGWEPLHACYTRTCLVPMRVALKEGRRQASAFYANIHIRALSANEMQSYDPHLQATVSVNTPDAWADALTRLSQQAGSE